MNTPVRHSEKLSGRRAIVTGGSRGIGAAIARAFAVEGAAVVIIHRKDQVNAERTLETLKAFNERCLALDCDVADQQQVQASVDTVMRQLGGIDILVNCAGVGLGSPFEDTTLEEWNQVMDVNLTGAFLMSRYCYPSMKKNRWGRIINIASQKAFSGCPGAVAYGASKAGMVGLTRSLALEAAEFGVLVNGIAPGATDTDLLKGAGEEALAELRRKIPLGRFAQPEEIAPTAVLLASDEGTFYVGQTLSPNGGDVLR